MVDLIVWQRSDLTGSATVTRSSSLGALYGLTWRQMNLALTALAEHGFIGYPASPGKSRSSPCGGGFELRHLESSP